MKRKEVNPNPQEKKIRKLEERLCDNEVKEEELEAEEMFEEEKEKIVKEKCRCKCKMK